MNKRIQIILILAVLLGITLIPTGAVIAQEGPMQVFFNPDPAYIYTDSNKTVINVDLTNVIGLWSFDIAFEYDPNIAIIESYEIVDNFGGIQCPWKVNNPGFFGLGCTAWGGVIFTGDTTAVKLTFRGVNPGQTALSFTSFTSFNDRDQITIPHVSDNGLVRVVDPTNFIHLPMIMNVSIQGVVNRGGIKVDLGRGTNFGMGPYSGTSTDISGNNLTITNVVADSYRISTNQPRVLNITAEMNKNFVLASGANHVPALKLVAGNADWSDNEINIDDWTVICGAWGDASLNPDADVNFDGAVDARDLALVAGNYGLNSEVAYAAWLP